MTTKFSPILKVRRLEVERVENELSKLNNQKKSLSLEIDSLKDELEKNSYPKSGQIQNLKQNFFKNTLIKKNIELKLQNIKFLEEQIKSTQELLKKAMLEYEKINHLHKVEEKKMIEALKKQEVKELDEIANILFRLKKEVI